MLARAWPLCGQRRSVELHRTPRQHPAQSRGGQGRRAAAATAETGERHCHAPITEFWLISRKRFSKKTLRYGYVSLFATLTSISRTWVRPRMGVGHDQVQ